LATLFPRAEMSPLTLCLFCRDIAPKYLQPQSVCQFRLL
jgi:hypothetical protein